MIKIIAGKYKGRIIPTIKNAEYRPSTGRFREALFNILSSGIFLEDKIIENANLLDLFAGSGSLAFEALSRGAKTITLVDINEIYLKHAKNFAEKIDRSEDLSCLKASAINLPYSGKQYNLVLMDPPYNKNFISKTLKSLIKENWLEANAIIAIEVEKTEDIEIPKLMNILDERRYGNSKLVILKYEQK